MALERLTLAGAIAVASSFWTCDTRTVYLVPIGASLSGAGGKVAVDSGGASGSGGANVLPMDEGGVLDSGRPACEKQRYPEEPQPLGVYIMVDQSTAMKSQWTSVSNALQQFIRESAQLGKVSVGIQYYALDIDAPPFGTYLNVVCQPSVYSTPRIAIAPLPGNTSALLDSIKAHDPTVFDALLQGIGLLPTESPVDSALRGAISGARAWTDSDGGGPPKAVVLLVTNGIPDATASPLCKPTVANAVAAAANGLPGISTYVLDVGPPNADLDAIAKAGGTDHAYTAANGTDVPAALQSIREVALPCDVAVPVDAATSDLLNVELSRPGMKEPFGKVDGSANCSDASRKDEWYSAGSGAAATVRLCPSTCAYARSIKEATLDVVLGCKTKLIN